MIYNPTSGRGSGITLSKQVGEQLRASGYLLQSLPTEGPGDATRLAAGVAERSTADVVFAMGGDGTLREVAAGLLGSRVALGVIPAGTANVLARALGVPRRAVAAARSYQHSSIQRMDVGMIDRELFLMQVSAGLDAAIMAAQNATLKRWFGRLAFLSSGLRRWWTYSYRPMTLRVDRSTRTVAFFSACNIPHYGGNFRLAPAASVFDQQLDLVTNTADNRFSTLGFVRDLVRGRHLERADAAHVQVDRFEVVAPEEIRVQLDGDVRSIKTPCTVSIAERSLAVVVPSATR